VAARCMTWPGLRLYIQQGYVSFTTNDKHHSTLVTIPASAITGGRRQEQLPRGVLEGIESVSGKKAVDSVGRTVKN
jgi:hypothetical protein